MRAAIQISLKPGERIFINGAVLRVDRKVNIELLNDVTFLLEAHVMQPEQATTPLRQLYFMVQAMLMEPTQAGPAVEVFQKTHALLMATFQNEHILNGLEVAGEFVSGNRAFDALKTIRGLFPIEDAILSGAVEQQEIINSKREVA